jgi:hypothetical protein
MEQPSSGTLNIENLESQVIWSFGINKMKWHKQDSQTQLRSYMPEEEEL